MDLMETQGEDVDHFVFDCGEDELEQCQEHYYYSKENDIMELVGTIKSCQSSLAGRWHEEARSSPLPVKSTVLHSVTATSSVAITTSSQPIVVQANTGMGNPAGYMIFNPGSVRLVSSGSNLKLYSAAPTTAVANSSAAVSTFPSLSPVQPRFAARTLHSLPQQLTTVQYRQQLRALSPSVLNTKVVNSSPTMLATSERRAAPGIRVQVHVAPSAAQTQTTFSTAHIEIGVPRTNPCPAQFKIVAKSTTIPPHAPAVPLVTGVSQFGNVIAQATNVVPFTPTASQTKSVTQFVPKVSPATDVARCVPAASQAASAPQSIPLPQSASKITILPSHATNVVQNINNTSSNPMQTSLPLLPVTRMSPPPNSKSKPKEGLAQPNQISHKLPLNTQVSSNPPNKFGKSSEALKVVNSKKNANTSPYSSSSDLVDLTAEDNLTEVHNKVGTETSSSPPNKNFKKNFVKEKTFPSLVVTARPCMKVIPNAVATSERVQLDNQLRKVLQMAPQMFTEHLLQQRLLRSEQHCKTHSKNLKLGMYSDSARFPHSGGYVWISECCNAGFCSVFSGSIFDKTLLPPATTLKLMYHWSCNTAVHNVLQWVKVDNFIVKTYYTFFRAVCTAAVQEKMGLFGGAYKKVQVGVVSLGTPEGQGKKDVKVDILAALDTETMQLRLRALDNSVIRQDEDIYEKKLRRILGTLQEWVHPNSTIITDFAVDLPLCRQYGFGNVIVSGGKGSNTNNLEVVGYLKNWVPKMFQNTLNLLSLQIIQQFLDELVWREHWGPIPSRAYDSLLNHISEITKLPGPDIITKLKKIASFPTKNWKFSVWKNPADWNAVDQSSSEVDVKVPQLLAPTSVTNKGTCEVPTVSLTPELKPKAKEPPISQDTSSKVRTSLLSYKEAPGKGNISVPLELKAKEPPLSQDTSSKLRTSLLSYKEAPGKIKISKDNEMAMRKPGPSFPTRTNAVPSVYDNKLRTILPNSQDTFDIDDIVPLESYYYGYTNGIPKRQKCSGAFLAECALCKRDFLTGSSFTDHLIHHALNDSEAWAKESTNQLMSVCKVCLLPVQDVSTHISIKHPKPLSSVQTACKICNIDHKSEERLYKHMANVHCELDMPYNCEVCLFRTSVYDDAAVHFKDCHDKDTCVQCPFCLKVIRFCTVGGLDITSNQLYFIQHIQKHNVSKLNRKCEKCLLSFTNMGILKSHQENFHCSGKNLHNAVRYHKNSSKFIKIKRPHTSPFPPVTLHESSFHTLKGKVLASIFSVDPSLSNFNCAECDSPIVQNHFSVKMTCTKCSFQSHCANAIKEHSARTHLTLDVLVSKLPQIVGGTPLTEKTLHCSKCTFSSSNGNKMATHLAECENSAVATAEKRKLTYSNCDERSEPYKKHKKYK